MEELDEGEGNKPAQVIRASQGPGSGKDSGGWDEVESYVGELRASDRVRHGYGIGVYQAYRKERFEGWWKNGKRYKGKNHYLNPGDTYVGTFTDGVLTGTGVSKMSKNVEVEAVGCSRSRSRSSRSRSRSEQSVLCNF
eukprot:GEZU01005305.1.p1 GENE.GEZU01005305.1~~GEZU01005305.1.p1  ORF type:complete len:138 (+),score=11.41 GEZU01005305.1:1158-1571(+)